MKAISRSLPLKRNDCFHRFLKPGALARLRDSRISARSHKPNSLVHSTAGRIDLPQAPEISMFDQVPCLLSKIDGPRCLKRRKLMVARSAFLLNLGSSGPVLESSNGSSNDSLITLLNDDVIIAH